jgi:hypothetical protein
MKSARLLSNNSPVEMTPAAGGIVLRLPESRDPYDTVIVLE